MIIVVNSFFDRETAGVEALLARFGDSLRIVTTQGRFPNVLPAQKWIVPDANKQTVEWTRRWLTKFVELGQSEVVKVDPDTVFTDPVDLTPVSPCDVAGDFRMSPLGPVFLGACQYFTIHAAWVLLSDPKYVGSCIYQDIALASAITRNGLKSGSIRSLNSWAMPSDPPTSIRHRGGGKPLLPIS